MPLWLVTAVAGVALRQADRLWQAAQRPGHGGLPALMRHQRARSNDITPALLMAGQWTQIAGCWMLADQLGPLGWCAAAIGVAVQLRHLQEVSHFAVHGALTRTRRVGTLLSEALVHHPLGFVPLTVRRHRHVRDHHPNATVAGIDPNLAELTDAGLTVGVGAGRFALSLIHPLTPRGAAANISALARNLRPVPGSRLRAVTVALVLALAYTVGGWSAVVFGWLIPRLLLYPQLAWLSLLVEHTWFDPASAPPGATHAELEAGRCLRLYPRNRILAVLAASTWLPYGDLHHFAHSAHPGVRWNHLPALERQLGLPYYAPGALMLGASSVVGRHRQALQAKPEPHRALGPLATSATK
ncbi:fatty acid desaturase [Streptacidiphilus sp. BW17]|uniref:fatty acid desaturase n=1 Tax=Streptacidiphilus sp. BW17 TaxID=3156274 RepID=UPI00351985F4